MRTDMINGAIFDMDVVLIDSMPIWHNAGALFLEANGKKPRSDLQKILFDKSMMAGAEYMRDAYDLPMTMEKVMQGVIDVVYKHYKESIPAKANVENFLRKLKEKDIAIALATSSDRKLLEAGLSRLHLLSYFDTTVTCLEAGVGKIEPDVYLEAMKRIGTTLENTWVFEDAYHALHTAKKAGFHTVALYDASNDEHQELLKKEADIYLKDLTDFDTFYQFATRES